MIEVGDLVRAKHWESRYFALVVRIRRTGLICSVAINGDLDHIVDQYIKDLEVL